MDEKIIKNILLRLDCIEKILYANGVHQKKKPERSR